MKLIELNRQQNWNSWSHELMTKTNTLQILPQLIGKLSTMMLYPKISFSQWFKNYLCSELLCIKWEWMGSSDIYQVKELNFSIFNTIRYCSYLAMTKELASRRHLLEIRNIKTRNVYSTTTTPLTIWCSVLLWRLTLGDWLPAPSVWTYCSCTNISAQQPPSE